jgi:hypothetical protein
MVLLSRARRDEGAWWVDWLISSGVLLEILRFIAGRSGESMLSRGSINTQLYPHLSIFKSVYCLVYCTGEVMTRQGHQSGKPLAPLARAYQPYDIIRLLCGCALHTLLARTCEGPEASAATCPSARSRYAITSKIGTITIICSLA